MNTGSEQDLLRIDGMEGSLAAGSGLASIGKDKPGAFEWKRFLLERWPDLPRGRWHLKALDAAA